MRRSSLMGLAVLLAISGPAAIGTAQAASPDTRAGSPAARAHAADRAAVAQMRPRGHAGRFWPYGYYRRFGYGDSGSYSNSDTIDDLPVEPQSPPPETTFTIQFSTRDPEAKHTYYSSWVARCEAQVRQLRPAQRNLWRKGRRPASLPVVRSAGSLRSRPEQRNRAGARSARGRRLAAARPAYLPAKTEVGLGMAPGEVTRHPAGSHRGCDRVPLPTDVWPRWRRRPARPGADRLAQLILYQPSRLKGIRTAVVRPGCGAQGGVEVA